MTYSPQDERRISNFVRHRERWPQNQYPDKSPYGATYLRPVMAQASEDINHLATGTCTVLQADRTQSTDEDAWINFSAATDTFEAFNPGLKVWNGAPVLLVMCAVENQAPRWNILHHFSATLCHFKTKTNPFGALPANTVRNCTVVKPLDGHYSATSVDVESIGVTINYNIGEQIDILAELVYDGLVGTKDFWQLYSTDCEPP